jgi:hypothetical protein
VLDALLSSGRWAWAVLARPGPCVLRRCLILSVWVACRRSTDVFAGAGISGSKSDSSELSCSSAVWGKSVVVCGAVKSLIAA